jgi:calcium-dependent protein kinase
VISYTEFVTATINREQVIQKKNLRKAFNTFDIDGSGKLSLDELVQSIGIENEISDVFKQAD